MTFLNELSLLYKFGMLLILVLLGVFEALYYCKDNNLTKNKSAFLIRSLIANAITGAFIFIPVDFVDFILIAVYVVRSIFVGREFIKLNYHRKYHQARNSYIYTQFLSLIVLVIYIFLFLFIIGLIDTFMFGW